MFPGAHAQVYRNEAGEPLGWDYPSQDDGDPGDPYDDYCAYDEPDIYCDYCGETDHEESDCPNKVACDCRVPRVQDDGFCSDCGLPKPID